MKPQDFRGQVALVTGAGSGIGRALAHQLAAGGAWLAVTDRDPARLEAVVSEIAVQGTPVRGYRVDHASLAEVEACRDALLAEWGGVDVLCANVGVGYTCSLTEMQVADWERVMAVNFWSAVYVVQLFAPAMIARRRGRILLTASLAGLIGLPTASAYCASKFALVGLGESLRAELARSGVGVTVLCPGMVRTSFTRDGSFSFGDLPLGARTLDRLWQRLGEDPATVARRGLRGLRKGAGIVPSSLPLVTLPWLAKRIIGDRLGAALALAVRAFARPRSDPGALLGLHDLRRMRGSQIDALYESATTPAPDELDGPYRGVLLRWQIQPWMRRAGPLAPGRLPWRGKVFFAAEQAGANRFGLGSRERHVWRFRTRLVDSRFGGERALSIDYDLPGNPGWLRRGVFDELKKVRAGLYLGKGGVQLGGGRSLVFTWALRTPASSTPLGRESRR